MRPIITHLFTLLACSNFIHNPTTAFQLHMSQFPCSIKNPSSRKTFSTASRIISHTSSSSLDSTRNHDAPSNEKDETGSKTTTGATSATSPPTVVCIGETLWDSLPSGMYLGGAPANVAVHLASLFRHWASGNDENDSRPPTVAVATCVGNDQLGREAQRRLELKGVRTDYIQFHEKWETGELKTSSSQQLFWLSFYLLAQIYDCISCVCIVCWCAHLNLNAGLRRNEYCNNQQRWRCHL